MNSKKIKCFSELRRQRKGLASVIMAVFLILVILTLTISTFSAVQISAKYLEENLRFQQEKDKEIILLQIGCLITSEDKITHIIVNNTGSILLTIRGIYINSKLITDPKLSINSQESDLIDLSDKNVSFSLNKFNELVITTERGNTFKYMIRDISTLTIEGGDSAVYGPFRFLYDEFHWTSHVNNYNINYLELPTTTWQDGWRVPPKEEVIWRLRFQNVDSKNHILNLGPNSALSIIKTSGGQREYFYIDVLCSDITIRPKEYATVYFHSSAGIPNTIGTYLNFLVLESNDGERTIAQTIPFHAILVG